MTSGGIESSLVKPEIFRKGDNPNENIGGK
jgi:hypothetical protein